MGHLARICFSMWLFFFLTVCFNCLGSTLVFVFKLSRIVAWIRVITYNRLKLLPWISRTPTPYNFEPFGSTAFVAAAAAPRCCHWWIDGVSSGASFSSSCPCWHFFVFDLAGHVPYARSVADSRNCVSVSNYIYILWLFAQWHWMMINIGWMGWLPRCSGGLAFLYFWRGRMWPQISSFGAWQWAGETGPQVSVKHVPHGATWKFQQWGRSAGKRLSSTHTVTLQSEIITLGLPFWTYMSSYFFRINLTCAWEPSWHTIVFVACVFFFFFWPFVHISWSSTLSTIASNETLAVRCTKLEQSRCPVG